MWIQFNRDRLILPIFWRFNFTMLV